MSSIVQVLQTPFNILSHCPRQLSLKEFSDTAFFNIAIKMATLLVQLQQIHDACKTVDTIFKDGTKWPKIKQAYWALVNADPDVRQFFIKIRSDQPDQISLLEADKALEVLQKVGPEILKLFDRLYPNDELDERCAQQLDEARTRLLREHTLVLNLNVITGLVSSSLSKTCSRTDIGEQTYWAQSSLKTCADRFIYGGFNELIEDIHLAYTR